MAVATPQANADQNMQQAPCDEAQCGNRAGTETPCRLRATLWELFDPRDSLRTLKPCSSAAEGRGGGDRLACLDAVRAMAFMWVLHVHSLEFLGDKNQELFDEAQRAWWLRLAFTGACGVDVFFVLSGLLIAWGNFKRETAAEKELGAPRAFGRRYVVFLVRRFFRLWPTLALAMVFKTLPIFPHGTKGLWKWGWAYLTFTANLFPDSSETSYLDPLWTVGVEFQMYILTPFICEMIYNRRTGSVRKHAYWVLALVSAASVLLRAWWAYGPAQLGAVRAVAGEVASVEYTHPLARLSPYISGIAVAVALERRRAGAAGAGTAADNEVSEAEEPASATPGTCRAQLLCLSNAALDATAFAVIVTACIFGWEYSLFSVETLSDFWRPVLLAILTPSFGWAIARCIYRTITAEPTSEGARCQLRLWRCTQVILSAKPWAGVAMLSYVGYVMQDFVSELITVPLVTALGLAWEELDWDELGVGTLRFGIVYMVHVLMVVLYSLPCHFLVEIPGIRLGRRVEGALRRGLTPRPAAEPAHENAAGVPVAVSV